MTVVSDQWSVIGGQWSVVSGQKQARGLQLSTVIKDEPLASIADS
jgi:hypothetical protein